MAFFDNVLGPSFKNEVYVRKIASKYINTRIQLIHDAVRAKYDSDMRSMLFTSYDDEDTSGYQHRAIFIVPYMNNIDYQRRIIPGQRRIPDIVKQEFDIDMYPQFCVPMQNIEDVDSDWAMATIFSMDKLGVPYGECVCMRTDECVAEMSKIMTLIPGMKFAVLIKKVIGNGAYRRIWLK